MSKGLEYLATGKKRTKVVATLDNGNALLSKQEIEAVEKELKALEILRNKKVNLEYLKCCGNYGQYKTVCSYWNEITKQEFDLLKEVLLGEYQNE